MTRIYFAADNRAGGRNGSADRPYRHPGEMPLPWTMQGGCEYLFRCDTANDWTGQLVLPARTDLPIVVGSWGQGARPVLRRYRMIDRSACVEVGVSSSGTAATTPKSGTNLWRVPSQFYGLFAGDVWGVRCDIAGAQTGTDHRTPSAPYEWGRSDLVGTTATSHVVYSVGNPVDTYGGLVSNGVADADYANSSKRAAIYAYQPAGGFTLSGVDFERCAQALRVKPGAALLPGLIVEKMAARSVQYGVLLSGDGSYAAGDIALVSGNGFRDALLRGLYGENIGGSFVQATHDGLCVNGLRMFDFVVNGCGRSESSGAVYMDHSYCTDGGRALIERGTVSGQEWAHFWPVDGYAFYQENSTADLEWRHCFGWGNASNYHHNNPGRNNVLRECVAIAMPDSPADTDTFHNGNSNPNADVLLDGCTALGFRRFSTLINGTSGRYAYRGNVSRSNGDPGGASNANAIRVYDYSRACVSVDGNSFSGHDYALFDGKAGKDRSADVTNPAADDGEWRRIPVPTDPTVNYAMHLLPW